MNILYIIKDEPDETLSTIIDIHEKEHDVTKVDLREEKDYGKIIELVVLADKVICV